VSRADRLGRYRNAPLGDRPSRYLTLRIPADLADALDAEVKRSGLPRAVLLRSIVRLGLAESRKVPPYQPW
jgi:hypothetical protein